MVIIAYGRAWGLLISLARSLLSIERLRCLGYGVKNHEVTRRGFADGVREHVGEGLVLVTLEMLVSTFVQGGGYVFLWVGGRGGRKPCERCESVGFVAVPNCWPKRIFIS